MPSLTGKYTEDHVLVIGEFGLDVVESYLPIVLVAGGYFEDHPQGCLLAQS